MAATEPAPYLLGLRLAGRRVLVVGAGAVAARRMPALLDAGADVVVISPEAAPAIRDLAATGRVSWVRRRYAPGDCAGAWLVCASGGDPAVSAAVAADADAAGIWCVRADDAAASRAVTPASGVSGEVRVGVLSGDPGRSAGIRDAVVAAVGSGKLDVRRGRRSTHRGWVALIGGGPGDPGLITVRGRQLLAEADVVVADRLAPRSLLTELSSQVEIVDAAKIPGRRSMAQDDIHEVLISRARAGRFVARLKGGDPFVFGRGGEEVLACLRAGVPVTVVPGVSSAVAVPAMAGVPLTQRGISQEFHVVSAHVPPGDERSTVDWRALAASAATLVLLMATEHLSGVADALIKNGRPAGTPVSVIADGTLPSQRTIYARLDTVGRESARAGLSPPAVVVVGDVVSVAEQIADLCGELPVRARRGRFTPGSSQAQLTPPPLGNDLGREG